jgi:hypothetical protein
MADKCYNIFTFFGNQEVHNQVLTWFDELKKFHNPPKDLPYSPSALFKVFLPNVKEDSIAWFGQKWVYPDFGTEIDLYIHELGFVSSYDSPDGLQDLLTEELSKLDKNVVIVNSYNSYEYEEACRYSARGTDGEIHTQWCYLQSIDSEDEEKFDYQVFYEHQMDAISDLIEAVPGIKKNIKNELKRVTKLFDDTFKK